MSSVSSAVASDVLRRLSINSSLAHQRMSVSDVLVFGSRVAAGERLEPVRAADAARRVLGAAGLVLAIVGWTDWALLWVPLRFGVVEWEFGTISQSFDALPLATIGTAALVAAALNGGWR